MNKILKFIPLLFFVIGFGLVLFYVSQHPITLFNPKGYIAQKESWLLTTFILLMLGIAIPSVGLTFFVAWKFRATNPKAEYNPNAKHSILLEILWWAIPTAIVCFMATVTWFMTHALDPMKPIKQSPTSQMTIQVVALRWKWLFIYPQEHIATVNTVVFPVKTPVSFELTADGPMSSFWIPNLGGQLYAMANMVNRLHLMATVPGEYPGETTEINGQGFSDMRFTAKAVTQAEYNDWVKAVKKSKNTLTWDTYKVLAEPTVDNPSFFYSTVDNNLYNLIVAKDMKPKVVTHD